jgi:ATP-dependent Lon protease
MTGEITLRGHVLPVGGIREKFLSAHRSGLKTVIMPKRNAKDLIDVPKRARNEMKLVLVDHIDQVLEVALLPPKPEENHHHRASRKSKKLIAEKAVEINQTLNPAHS